MAEPGVRIALTHREKTILNSVEQFVLARRRKGSAGEDVAYETRLPFINDFPTRERKFLTQLAADLNLFLAWDEYDDQSRNLATLYLPDPDAEDADPNEDDDEQWEDMDEEADAAVDRVLKRYRKIKVEDDAESFEEKEDAKLRARMADWKQTYYQVWSRSAWGGL